MSATLRPHWAVRLGDWRRACSVGCYTCNEKHPGPIGCTGRGARALGKRAASDFAHENPLELATRAAVVADIERGTVFYSHDEFDRDEALVIVRTSAEQRKYLSTVADRRETNKLLALARF